MSTPNAAAVFQIRDAAVVSHNVVGQFPTSEIGPELASQLILGTRVTILELADEADTRDPLARVESEDRYTGWVRARYLAKPSSFDDIPTTTIATLIADVYTSPTAASQLLTKLCVTTPVVLARHSTEREFVPILLPGGETGYTHRANLSSHYQRESAMQSIDMFSDGQELRRQMPAIVTAVAQATVPSAMLLIGTPYLWGGTTPFGIDCSGLTQLTYKISGIQLLRDANMQILDRRFVPVDEGRGMDVADFDPGDLIFFHGRFGASEGRITHVGLAIGDGSFVHAAGGGRGTIVSRCDDPFWSVIYAGARRLSPDADLSIKAA